MTKNSRQVFKYFGKEESFLDETKSIFHYFWSAVIEENKTKFFGRSESDFNNK